MVAAQARCTTPTLSDFMIRESAECECHDSIRVSVICVKYLSLQMSA